MDHCTCTYGSELKLLLNNQTKSKHRFRRQKKIRWHSVASQQANMTAAFSQAKSTYNIKFKLSMSEKKIRSETGR